MEAKEQVLEAMRKAGVPLCWQGGRAHWPRPQGC